MLPKRIPCGKKHTKVTNGFSSARHSSGRLGGFGERQGQKDAVLSQWVEKTFRTNQTGPNNSTICKRVLVKKKISTGSFARRIIRASHHVKNGSASGMDRKGSVHRSSGKTSTQRTVFNARASQCDIRQSKVDALAPIYFDRHEHGSAKGCNPRFDVGSREPKTWATGLQRPRAGDNEKTQDSRSRWEGCDRSFDINEERSELQLCDRIFWQAYQKHKTRLQRCGQRSRAFMGHPSHSETLGYFMAGRGWIFRGSDKRFDSNKPRYGAPNLSKIFAGLLERADRFARQC